MYPRTRVCFILPIMHVVNSGQNNITFINSDVYSNSV